MLRNMTLKDFFILSLKQLPPDQVVVKYMSAQYTAAEMIEHIDADDSVAQQYCTDTVYVIQKLIFKV